MNHLWWSMMVSDDLKHTKDQNSLACPETYWNSFFTGTKCIQIVQMKLVMKPGTEPPNKRLPPSTQCSSIGLAKDWKSLAKSSSLAAVSKQVAAIISRSDKSSNTWMAHVGSKLQVLSRVCLPIAVLLGKPLALCCRGTAHTCSDSPWTLQQSHHTQTMIETTRDNSGVFENVVYPEKPNGFADHYPY